MTETTTGKPTRAQSQFQALNGQLTLLVQTAAAVRSEIAALDHAARRDHISSQTHEEWLRAYDGDAP